MRVVRLLLPPDPGASRLLAALRATLAGVVTFFLVMLGSVVALPVTDRILGFGIALFIAANVRDGTPRTRLVTIAMAPLFAFAATTLAALLYDQPLAAATLLRLIMFVVAYGATRGPHWASLGIVTPIAYFIGLVTHESPATLPKRFVVLLIAAEVTALIRCVLLPERPRVELDRLHHAIHAAVLRVTNRPSDRHTDGQPAEPPVAPARDDLPRAVRLLLRIEAVPVHFAARRPSWPADRTRNGDHRTL